VVVRRIPEWRAAARVIDAGQLQVRRKLVEFIVKIFEIFLLIIRIEIGGFDSKYF
jgi:hypothetical protein